MGWFEEGLREIGLTKEAFNKLSKKTRDAIKDSLKEMGHFA